MPTYAMAMWPNETYDLVYVVAADDSELYPAIAHVEIIRDATSGGDSVEMHLGIASSIAHSAARIAA